MWWTLILVAVGWMLFSFLRDRNKQAISIAKQGGMQNKYKVLTDYMLSCDDFHIIQESSSSIRIGSVSVGGSNIFDITQTFGTVTIQYYSKSILMGSHNLKWQFDEFMDQMKMMDKIEHDIKIYMQNVFSKYE